MIKTISNKSPDVGAELSYNSHAAAKARAAAAKSNVAMSDLSNGTKNLVRLSL
jgi:hypothetical protein